MRIIPLSSSIICSYLISLSCLTLCLSAAASVLATTDTNISCPDGVYKGIFDLTIIKKDLGPIKNRIDDLTFFYGAEPDPSQGKDEIQLKSLMICSNTGEKIRTATRHIGSYRFLGQQCRIILNGKGSIKVAELTEQGNAKLTCKDKFVYQGTYTVTAVNLLLAGKEQADEAGEQKAESTDSSLPGNGQGALITTPEEEDDTTDFDFSSILGL